MNNLEELKQELKKIENKINELENKGIEEINKYKRKRCENGERYWFLNSLGEAELASDCNGDEDDFSYNIGNYFKTDEQVKNYKEKLLIEQELRDIAMELNKGEKICWEVDSQYKYYLCYDFSDDIIIDDNYSIFARKQGIIYCLDENFKDVVIKRIGKERLTKYLKGELD